MADATVKFIGSKEHGTQHGYYSKEKGFTGGDEYFVVQRKGKEYVVVCDDTALLDELIQLESEYFVTRVKEITAYLDARNITWSIEGKPAKI